uniref:Nucleoside diphosphate kinase-like domain-containing protein n=1 Tax=Chromera velia CCMP2878 TaxID=1169474 RepID=A0A0G4FPF0_9ALVE|eukprot:Cvel_3601.t1-p1 / transcript=Cvel_3601.t1 / gene=Cvel_3601 / organism=Chromera_velia_CCMP2878 / gene_product=Adenylate kinase isoenzyme 1, putative / transcript_product=Adenylate kinase isoenzyme 1, putative / location=Cvel_scaffold147:107263-122981(-) / protein_length=1580 / sequence_SO=supercontig / SO=protein_coding / is_pseudo=false
MDQRTDEFRETVLFMTSGPVEILVVEHIEHGAIEALNKLAGPEGQVEALRGAMQASEDKKNTWLAYVAKKEAEANAAAGEEGEGGAPPAPAAPAEGGEGGEEGGEGGEAAAAPPGAEEEKVPPEWDPENEPDTFSLRGFFGESDIKDGVHVSADPWAALRERDFFFPFLDRCALERTLLVVKADAVSKAEEIQRLLNNAGLFVVRSGRQAGKAGRERRVQKVRGTGKEREAFCVEGPAAIMKSQLLMGPEDAAVAKTKAPWSVRALFGSSALKNAVHVSADEESAASELRTFFPEDAAGSVDRTLAMIKPDAHGKGSSVAIEEMMEAAGFTIIKRREALLSRKRAEEFYAEHRSKPFFSNLVTFMSSGPIVALVLSRKGAIPVWRQLMGPTDSNAARAKRPSSVRALFGTDGTRNACHGSDSQMSAEREIQFFFPDIPLDPLPSDAALRDFVFRKSAKMSDKLDSLSQEDFNKGFKVELSLQAFLSRGLTALCKEKATGVQAVKWLADWLEQNNPNKAEVSHPSNYTSLTASASPNQKTLDGGSAISPEGAAFSVAHAGPAKAGARLVPSGSNAVEAAVEKPNEVVEVDVMREEPETTTEFSAEPPFIVFVVGGPGSGKGTQCHLMKQEYGFVHLSAGDLLREEVAMGTPLGGEIETHMHLGTLVPSIVTVGLLRKSILAHREKGTNRFLIDGFPRALDQCEMFEQAVFPHAFTLYFDCSEQVMIARIQERSLTSGRVDDKPEAIQKRLATYDQQTKPVIFHYKRFGRAREVDASGDVESVFSQVRSLVAPRVLYLFGGAGSSDQEIAKKVAADYGYAHIDGDEEVRKEAAKNPEVAAIIKKRRAKNQTVPSAIVSPLVVAAAQAALGKKGAVRLVVTRFPEDAEQRAFFESQVRCVSSALVLDIPRHSMKSFALETNSNLREVEQDIRRAFLKPIVSLQKDLEAEGVLRRLNLGPLCECHLIKSVPSQKVETHIWNTVRDAVKPRVTLLCGPPGSDTAVLGAALVDKYGSGSSLYVDVPSLVFEEANRPTDFGRSLANALSQHMEHGKELSIEFLLQTIIKGACVSHPSHLILDNFPFQHDDMAELDKFFQIEKVFLIEGDKKYVDFCHHRHMKAFPESDIAGEAEEKRRQTEALHLFYGSKGRLEVIHAVAGAEGSVAEQIAEEALRRLAPKFVCVTGPPAAPVEAFVFSLSASLGFAALPPFPQMAATLIAEKWPEAAALQKQVNTGKIVPALMQKVVSEFVSRQGGAPGVILQRMPSDEAQLAALKDQLNITPLAHFHVQCDEEKMKEEASGAEGFEEEKYEADLEAHKKGAAAVVDKLAEEKNPEVMPVSVSLDIPAEPPILEKAVGTAMQSLTKATVLLMTAPQIEGFASALAAPLGTAGVKLCVVDADKLIDLENVTNPQIAEALLRDQIAKAGPSAGSVGGVKIDKSAVCLETWRMILGETFKQEMKGLFVLVNFPFEELDLLAPSRVRDQVAALEELCTVKGILPVMDKDSLKEVVEASLRGQQGADVELATLQAERAHRMVSDFLALQFGPRKLVKPSVKINDAKEGPVKVLAAFTKHFFAGDSDGLAQE